jgi:glycosyltransferase involved in cell wall biosynthesis
VSRATVAVLRAQQTGYLRRDMTTGAAPSIPGNGDVVPLVSVIVPTRNSVATLEAALRSVRAQTHPSIELIVVDNSSTDGTVDLARRYADAVHTHGPERSAQRNFGAEQSTGTTLLMLDSDMILEPTVVARCVEVQRTTAAAAVVVPERTVGEGFWTAVRALERSCYVGDEDIEAARFFTRDAYLRFSGYDETLSAGEDWDLPARMRSAGEGVVRADGVWVLHDEGRVRLLVHLRKKFYYGQTIGGYARKHKSLARRQFRLIRPAFRRHWKRLARHPVLAVSMILLKWAELVAGGAGLVAARRRGGADVS